MGDLDDGQPIEVLCMVRGELVIDGDDGRSSDVWLRLAGPPRYISALYSTGPPVPSC